jgi:hypothetical protein
MTAQHSGPALFTEACYAAPVTRTGFVFAFSATLAAAAVSSEARAEASAWATVNAGVTGLKQGSDDFHPRASFQFDAGFGSSPSNVFIVGLLFRVMPIIKEGTDLALYARGATRGFQTGDWGFAIDAGSYLRTWGAGDSRPTFGFSGSAVLGGPFGTQLTVIGQYGQGSAYSVSATLGIDLLRLTVYRQSALQWWPNPMSAGAKTASSR